MAVLAVVVQSLDITSKGVYAGFNHFLVFRNTQPITVDVFDYLREIKSNSTCDVMRAPPLLKNMTLDDWITDEKPDLSNVEFTYMGGELFVYQVIGLLASLFTIFIILPFTPNLRFCEEFLTFFFLHEIRISKLDILSIEYAKIFMWDWLIFLAFREQQESPRKCFTLGNSHLSEITELFL